MPFPCKHRAQQHGTELLQFPNAPLVCRAYDINNICL